MIPGYHHSIGINSKRGIGQEVDDVSFPALMIPDAHICPSVQDGLLDLMCKFGKQRFGFATFLEIEIGPFI
jgi:hypothetical protein